MKTETKTVSKKKMMGKKYTPPTLTVYGKLIEITTGGSGSDYENTGYTKLDKQPKP